MECSPWCESTVLGRFGGAWCLRCGETCHFQVSGLTDNVWQSNELSHSLFFSSAFYWMSYEKSRSLLVRKTTLNEAGGPVDAMTEFKLAFASGAISGMVRYAGLRNMKLSRICLANLTAFQLAAILTTPFDLIKTHRQIRSREGRLI